MTNPLSSSPGLVYSCCLTNTPFVWLPLFWLYQIDSHMLHDGRGSGQQRVLDVRLVVVPAQLGSEGLQHTEEQRQRSQETEINRLGEDIPMHTVTQVDLFPKVQTLKQVHHTAENTPHNSLAHYCIILIPSTRICFSEVAPQSSLLTTHTAT